MIKITAKCFIKKEFIGDFKTYASKLIEESRKEEGCLGYELYQDINNETVFSFIEEWKNAEFLNGHIESEHCKETFPKMEKLYLKEMELNVYTLVK